MDGEEDAWDGPNIRPPQVSVPDDRGRQRPSGSNIKYRHDRPQKSSNSQRRDIRRDDRRGRHGEDLRDRLNRPMDHPRGKDRGRRDIRRDQKRVDPRRSDHRSTHREGDSMGRGNRDERDARVKRMLQASMAKEKEMLKRRMLKEKEFQEAEQRIKRKRDRSRDRQVEGKKSRSGMNSPHHGARSPSSQQSKNSGDESDGNESGEEESEEGESDSGSTESEADTASEQSGATPDRDDSNVEDEEIVSGQSDDRDTEGERSDGDESDPRDAELKDLADKADHRRKNTPSDHSGTPSRSPTPRKSGDETEDDLDENEGADESTDHEKHAAANEIVKKESDKEYHASPIHNILDDLPPYLPSVLGCRSVDEFHVSCQIIQQ